MEKAVKNWQGNFLFSCLIIGTFVFLNGCTDPQYLSEKLLWHADRKAQDLLDGRTVDDLGEQELQRFIAFYRDVTINCPLEPLAAKAHFIISNVYIRKGDYLHAAEELEIICQNFSSHPKIASQAYKSLGALQELQGHWQKAEEYYQAIIDNYPLTRIGLQMPIYLMKHYQQQDDEITAANQFDTSMRHYQQLLEEYAQTQFVPLIRDYVATLYFQNRNIPQALALWDSIIDEYPRSRQAAGAYLMKANIYNSQKDFGNAIRTYEQFIEKYPASPLSSHAQFEKGMILFRQGNTEEAEKIFEQVIEKAARIPAVRLNALLGLSYVYGKQFKTEKLMEVYDIIRRDFPDSQAALSVPFLKGQYYEQMKQSALADTAFNEAAHEYERRIAESDRSSPRVREFYNLLAAVYLKRHQVEKAERLLRELADKYESNPMYLLDLASLYRSLHSSDEAVKVYQELIDRYPDNPFINKVATSQIEALQVTE